MPRWDIDPPGVKGVLTRVETHASDLASAAGWVASDFEMCGSAIGASIVTKALSDFATARAPELHAAASRISAAMTGTVTAVTDYIHGNLEMAKNAQTAAAQAPAAQAPATLPAPATARGHGPR